MFKFMSREAGSRSAGKNLAKIALSAVFSTILLAAAVPAFAATPMLSVTAQGNGNVQLTVSNADPYSQITLYRRQTTQLWTVISNYGQTNQSGYFSTLTSLAGDGSNNVVEQYVVVNGQQSSIVQTYPNGCYGYNCGGCTYNCGGSLSLNQTNVSVNAGQSVSVYANNASGSLYVSSNSNSSVTSVSVSGNTVNVYGITSGSSTASICSSNNGCAYLYVTVTGSNYSNLTFSPSSLSMQVGQSTVVHVQNASNNSVYISSNSNTSVASVYVNGTDINVTANNAGTTTVTICTNYGQCNSFTVTVNGYNYSNISFSQSNVYLNTNQSQNVTVYGNSSNSYYVSSNSNSSVVSASISGNTLYLYATGTWGTSNITVCQSGSSCGTVYVTVNGYQNNNCTYNCYSNSGNLTFVTTSLPAMYIGQYYSYQLQVNGGYAPYTYSVTSGQLPSGLTMTSAGFIYGTPQNTYYNNFTVRVTDNYGNSTSANVSLGSSGNVLGASTYKNGQLINENGTVYIVYNNTKTAFGNANAFLGLGFNWGQVISTGYTGIPSSGYIVSTANAAHPWGSWIKDGGQTVYYVHELGLIPVGDYQTFLNNGGSDNLVVRANSYDFQRPMLSTMVMNDSRLR